MQKIVKGIILTIVLLVFLSSNANAGGNNVLTKEEFDKWSFLPEYTIFNFFPSKGGNCTWYAHGRMMQLGYSKYALDSMRFNANSWADDAARGAVVTGKPKAASIAFWESNAFFGSFLGHVGVVEVVNEDGSILVSDSSSSGTSYRSRIINPEDSLWPTAFIIVPEGPKHSKVFHPGETVQTTAGRLNFRLEGVNQPSILLEKGTIAKIQEHTSNGIYASQPGSFFSYHYWWYAAVDIDGEIKFGWMAETYIEKAGHSGKDAEDEPGPGLEDEADPETQPDSETDSELNPDSDSGSDPEDEQEQEKKPEPEPEPEPDLGPAPNPEPEQETGQEEEPGPGQDAEPEENTEAENGPDSKQEAEDEADLCRAHKPGDVYGDGWVNVLDAVLTMHYVMGTELLDEDQKKAADVNGDGQVDIRDVVLMMQYVLKIIDSFSLKTG